MVDRWLSYRQLLSMDIYKDKTEEELSDYKIRGEEIFNIALQYGAIDWYDWRISNWGTKWNAYETDIDSSDGSVEIYFCTANNGVVPIIKNLLRSTLTLSSYTSLLMRSLPVIVAKYTE